MAEKHTNQAAIRVEGLHKDFILPHERHTGIKQYLINIFKQKKGYEHQKVLKDLTFEVKKGDFFGIVGRNGSGKSTLLKLLAGIYTPGKGLIQVDGTLIPFIELGVGFNPELTGRENIFLNGALLGFSRKEMDAKYDSIVEFSELERFMDQKLKNYSSGMQVRLAFSIAIRAKGDILLLDEVLAVGDAAFQQKCFDYFEQLKKDKKTVILVTHDMGAVERFCNKALLINKGRIEAVGSSQMIANKYNQLNQAQIEKDTKAQAERESNEDQTGIKMNIETGVMYKYGEKLTFTITWDKERIKGVKNAGVALFAANGEYVFATNTVIDKYKLNEGRISITYDLALGDGTYFFKIGLFGKNDTDVIRFIDKGPEFIIKTNNKWHGRFKLDHEWK
ncbi:MAG TPA: ABC transporter ATP-binding protein [Candidatus Saccharimonadales bacterium]|nr:ABC transporter ATP-binding protein [Candidatus Saccharimonadales bacterium]